MARACLGDAGAGTKEDPITVDEVLAPTSAAIEATLGETEDEMAAATSSSLHTPSGSAAPAPSVAECDCTGCRLRNSEVKLEEIGGVVGSLPAGAVEISRSQCRRTGHIWSTALHLPAYDAWREAAGHWMEVVSYAACVSVATKDSGPEVWRLVDLVQNPKTLLEVAAYAQPVRCEISMAQAEEGLRVMYDSAQWLLVRCHSMAEKLERPLPLTKSLAISEVLAEQFEFMLDEGVRDELRECVWRFIYELSLESSSGTSGHDIHNQAADLAVYYFAQDLMACTTFLSHTEIHSASGTRTTLRHSGDIKWISKLVRSASYYHVRMGITIAQQVQMQYYFVGYLLHREWIAITSSVFDTSEDFGEFPNDFARARNARITRELFDRKNLGSKLPAIPSSVPETAGASHSVASAAAGPISSSYKTARSSIATSAAKSLPAVEKRSGIFAGSKSESEKDARLDAVEQTLDALSKAMRADKKVQAFVNTETYCWPASRSIAERLTEGGGPLEKNVRGWEAPSAYWIIAEARNTIEHILDDQGEELREFFQSWFSKYKRGKYKEVSTSPTWQAKFFFSEMIANDFLRKVGGVLEKWEGLKDGAEVLGLSLDEYGSSALHRAVKDWSAARVEDVLNGLHGDTNSMALTWRNKDNQTVLDLAHVQKKKIKSEWYAEEAERTIKLLKVAGERRRLWCLWRGWESQRT
eukprot:g6225.t1